MVVLKKRQSDAVLAVLRDVLNYSYQRHLLLFTVSIKKATIGFEATSLACLVFKLVAATEGN